VGEPGRQWRECHHAHGRREDGYPGAQRRVAEHVLQELLAHEDRSHQRPEDDDAAHRCHPEDPPPRHVQVVEGRPGPALAEEEPGPRGQRGQGRAEGQRTRAGDGREIDRYDQGRNENHRQYAAQMIEGVRGLVDV
jgi:hypothetical protein